MMPGRLLHSIVPEKVFPLSTFFLKKNLVLFSYSSSPTFPPWPPPPRTDDEDNQPFLPPPFFLLLRSLPNFGLVSPPSCPNITQRRREERKGGKWKWRRRTNLVLLLRPDVQVLTFGDQLEREGKFPTFSFQEVQLEQESFFVLSRLARKKCHVMESKFGESCTRTTPLLQNSIFFSGGGGGRESGGGGGILLYALKVPHPRSIKHKEE